MEDTTTDRETGSDELIRVLPFRGYQPNYRGIVMARDIETPFPLDDALPLVERLFLPEEWPNLMILKSFFRLRYYDRRDPTSPFLPPGRTYIEDYQLRDINHSDDTHRWLVLSNHFRRELNDRSRLLEGYIYVQGKWVHIDYWDMRASCPIISEAFHPNANSICEKCEMRGDSCHEKIQVPHLAEKYNEAVARAWFGYTGEKYTQAVHMPTLMLRLHRLEKDLPDIGPGYERIANHDVRNNPSDVIPQGKNEFLRPNQMNLRSYAIEENRQAVLEARQKGVETRDRHNQVCGGTQKYGEECAFRSQDCSRWKKGHHNPCTRRWKSTEELITNAMEGFRAKFGETLDEDIKFSYYHGNEYFEGMSKVSGSWRYEMRYRGLERVRDEYLHTVKSVTGDKASREIRVESLDAFGRYLRRYSPDAYKAFQKQRRELQFKPPLTNQQTLAVICAAQYQTLGGRSALGVEFSTPSARWANDGTTITWRTTHRTYEAYGIDWYAVNYMWPPYADA